MKTRLTYILTLALGALAFLLLPALVFAQATVNPPSDINITAEAQNFILQLLGSLMERHPIVATIVGILGTMRLWAKPLFSALHAIIDITPTKYDDGIWASVYRFFTETSAGRFVAYLLDWIASVKITPPAPAAAPAPASNP